MARPGRRKVLAIGLAALSACALLGWRLAGRIEGPDARRARRAFSEARYDEADAAASRWLIASPDSAEAQILQGRLELTKGRPAEAVERLKLARARGGSREGVLLLHALIAAKVGRHGEAAPVLARAFSSARTPDRQVDEALARAYLETYDLKRAEAVLGRWAADFPDDPKPHLWLVQVHGRDASRVGLVPDDYRAALKRDPSLAPARLGLAEELRKAHRNAEAAAQYEAYLATRPDDAVAHLGAGQNLAEMGDDPSAERHLRRAIELDAGGASAHTELAQLCSRRDDPASALGHLDLAVGIDPHDVAARNQRGLTLARLGRPDEARADLARAAQLRADLARLNEARSRLLTSPGDRASRLEIARWMFGHGHPEEGVRWAREILADRPGDPDASKLMAEHHDRRGEAGLANWYRINLTAGDGPDGTAGRSSAGP